MNSRNAIDPRPAAGLDVAVPVFARPGSEAATFARRLGSTVRAAARTSEAMLPLVVAGLHALREEEDRPALSVLVEDDEAARTLAEGIRPYRPGTPVGYLPGRGVEWGSGLEPAPHVVGERARALDVLAAGGIVVVSGAALAERIVPRDRRPAAVVVRRGDEIDRDDLVRRFVDAGYERVQGTVEERGQLSARGDVVDVFPSTGREPLRFELFGDEIERVSVFSVLTQRSLRDLDEARVYPAREDPAAPPAALFQDDDGSPHVPDGLVPVVPELVAAGPLLAWEPARVAEAVRERLRETHLPARLRGRALLREEDALETVEAAHALDSLPQGQPITFEGQAPALAARGITEAENELRALVRRGLRVVVAFPHRGDAERTALQLRRVEAHVLDEGAQLPSEPIVAFVVARVRRGLMAPTLDLAVLPAAQVFRRAVAATERRVGRAIASFTDLRPGDYVVHEDHGVARFAGFDTKTVAGVTRDYLELEFKGEDRIFLPHEQLGKLSRYIGADARPPVLSKLGGKAWHALKARARHAVREMAGELLALYAARQAVPGIAYGPDDELMQRLEDAFPYAETDDQARAIEAVKADLETPRPMDRLICGDVGFGKTEVAIRAAMKVVTGGRQVLLLTPTTILAQQHLATFRDRFRDVPVRIELVSRFRRGAEVRGVVADFRAGKVDILIGTHRVLSRDVVPADLGLVIVDEEQRFGVAQKELLRQLRTEVDVLALSATPIPRSLHMSLSGLRDISVIATPPRGRRPIRTHVGEFDEEIVRQALMREHERGGQSFYLHNRVESIDEAAERIRQLCPELRVAVGHGQMAERELEKVMEGFLRGEQDVLVATTIIESGLDIPTANTLIVERADLLGLAQLYQIRGRVGRSDVPAHAYLFYPDAETLSPEARARLAALADHTELGSGFRIAMRDLELRGAGNLLGDEQSGHVAAVGFELYCELLAEAVAELQGLARADGAGPPPVRVDAQVDAYVPADYVGLESAKMDVHRRIALAGTVDELRDVEAELADRFGPLPEPVRNLILLHEARLVLAPLGAVSLVVGRDRVTISGVSLGGSELRALRSAVPDVRVDAGRREVSHPIGSGRSGMEAGLEFAAAIIAIRTGAVPVPS